MKIILVSALPEANAFFGVRHHYPAAMSGPADGGPAGAHHATTGGRDIRGGLTFDVVAPGAPLPVTGGRSVAHLTGTSAAMLRTADELAARGVPYLFSPMLASVPSPLASLAGRLAAGLSMPGGAAAETALAARIAARACTVAARNIAERGYLNRTAGIAAVKLVTIPGPDVPDTLLHGRREANGGPEFGNLAVVFCDAIAPEWNVLRFLFAMEKINAGGVIATGRGDSAYARECTARAGLNPRIRFLFFEPGNAGPAAAEISGLPLRASILVDPSLRGLCGRAAAAAGAAGIPSVVSSRSLDASPPAPGMFTFDPSSWELLNHAMTTAFNRAVRGSAVGGPERPQKGSMSGAVRGADAGERAVAKTVQAEAATADGARGNTEIALMLEELYSRALSP